MADPVTLDFSKAQPIQAVTLDFSKAQPLAQPEKAGFGRNFLEGAGVTTDEEAKNFFRHPVDTLRNMGAAQHDLAVKAKEAFDRGDYKTAAIHAMNYMVPFIGPQTDKAGQQLSEGDIAGGVGRTLGVGATLALSSGDVRAVPGKVIPPIVRASAKAANAALEKAPGAVGAGAGSAIGGMVGSVLGDARTGAEIGGGFGYAIGKSVPTVQVPGENFGIKTPPIPKGPAEWMGAADAMELKKADPAAFARRQQQIAQYGLQDKPAVQRVTVQRSPDAVVPQGETIKATNDIVDQAVPPTADKAKNLRVKAEVDFYLKKGSVDKAEAALQKANPEFQPPGRIKTTNEIRDEIKAQAQQQDSLETKGIQEAMRNDLERHGQIAESEARKEFIARNSTGVTKSQLVNAARQALGQEPLPEKPVKFTKTPAPKPAAIPDDLTDILKESLAKAKRERGQK